jgi:hypothetical protein
MQQVPLITYSSLIPGGTITSPAALTRPLKTASAPKTYRPSPQSAVNAR